MKIIVDAMGGDHAPQAPVMGAIQAAKEYGVEIVLVGREDEILNVATGYNMVVSFHSIDNDSMDEMVWKHPDTVFVAAHPGEYTDFTRHLNRMKMSGNYYLDLSGTGLFRHGMLRHGIDEFGAERFLFGSDYPTCNPAVFIGGVALDTLITEAEKKLIFAGNAKRLLGLS